MLDVAVVNIWNAYRTVKEVDRVSSLDVDRKIVLGYSKSKSWFTLKVQFNEVTNCWVVELIMTEDFV
jgi:hypothetical protein